MTTSALVASCSRTNINTKSLLFLCLFITEFALTSGTSTNIIDHRPAFARAKTLDQLFEPKRKQETDSVVIGYHIAVHECQTRFKWNRWNCTLPQQLVQTRKPISMTKLLPRANRETAYMYAMVAAGVTYSLMRSCALGENNRCPCIVENTRPNKTRRTCKENLDYAFSRVRKIIRGIDVKDVSDPKRKLFNIKNFKAGIKTIQRELPTVCNCRGLSGTCQRKSCWKSTPHIGKVSESLRKLYDVAVKVSYDEKKSSFFKSKPRQRNIMFRPGNLRNLELVYLEDSPDYCHPNLLTGHKGTLLRYCDPDNKKTCNHLCESCGYRTVKRVVYERNCDKCRKHFTWCCTVSCGSCAVTKAQCMLPV
eukprot:gene11984-13222_t